MLAMDYTYNYPYSSGLKGEGLSLASYNENHGQAYFFNGRIIFPEQFSQQLGLLHRIVQTHFFKPMPAQLDPIVTCSDDYVRFEGFSGCCGVYVRMDCSTNSFDIDHLSKGTTNVDFNPAMQIAIRKLASSKNASLQVGSEELVLQSESNSVSEKRVKLPIRWLKGLGDIQNLQSNLNHQFRLESSKALSWFRQLPKGKGPSHPVYIGVRGGRLFSSPRAGKNMVRVAGLQRLKVLEPILLTGGQLDVWANTELGVSAWTVSGQIGRFTIVISPDLYRGFSGEGQLLSYFSSASKNEKVRALLHWQSDLVSEDIGKSVGISTDEANIALQQLSAEGLLGFDLAKGSYFHRQIPFDLKSIQSIQPRLKEAHKLLEENAVSVIEELKDSSVFKVKSKDTDYRVVLSDTGDKCNCSWFARYECKRGPCKHLLAAQIQNGDS